MPKATVKNPDTPMLTINLDIVETKPNNDLALGAQQSRLAIAGSSLYGGPDARIPERSNMRGLQTV